MKNLPGPTSSAPNRSKRRSPAFWALYVLYVLLVVVTVDYGCYLLDRTRASPYVRPPHADRPVAEVASATRQRLGVLRPPSMRSSAFGNFARQKPAGVVRIGCFGDSFTWGDEVADGNDYPALLAALFSRAGAPNVEVLNFGNTAFGFNQTYVMWEDVSRRYELDVAVVMPFTFWKRRDVTFAQRWARDDALTFHARHILTDDGLVRLDPLGTDHAERIRLYTRFVPPLRYLRYDRTAPPFLRAVLPAGRTVPNPFYYYPGSIDEEVRHLYRRLLRRMGTGQRRVIVADFGGRFTSFVGPLPQGIEAVPVKPGQSFIYQAPNRHQSPWGNRLVAAQIYEAITGIAVDAAQVLRTQGSVPGNGETRVPSLPPLVRINDIRIESGTLPVAGFYRYDPGVRKGRRVERFPPDVQSLIAIPMTGTSIMEAVFLPMPTLLTGQERVEVAVDHVRSVFLGHPETPGPGASLGLVDLCGSSGLGSVVRSRKQVRCYTSRPHRTERLPGRHLSVLLEGQPLIDATVAKGGRVIQLSPGHTYYQIRADGWIQPTSGAPAEGDRVSLSYVESKDGRQRIPIATWRNAPPD